MPNFDGGERCRHINSHTEGRWISFDIGGPLDQRTEASYPYQRRVSAALTYYQVVVLLWPLDTMSLILKECHYWITNMLFNFYFLQIPEDVLGRNANCINHDFSIVSCIPMIYILKWLNYLHESAWHQHSRKNNS